MQKCLNCIEPAHYVVQNTGSATQYFCFNHLPKFINPKKLPDHVVLFAGRKLPVDVVAEAPAPTKTKKKSEPKPEPVVEVVAEEIPVEE